MNTSCHLTADDLCAVESTGNEWTAIGFQHWTRSHSDANGDNLVMYLTADDARRIADHFDALADDMASRDLERTESAA
jgi:hypothetical protein